ncbi:MAG: cobyric acid synthase [Acidimicrobiales bacterium]
MVCGTTSDAGKSTVVAGLCRLLARRGVKVAPFKAQNMALNSAVTATGHEIGRAQAAQAHAAGVEPEVAMNPILLKPTSDCTSQVVVNGRPVGHLSAAEYHDRKPQLLGTVLAALGELRSRYDVVVAEGAGSPAEINLLDHDIVNLRVADAAGLPAVVVGDIDRGGVFASLYGTVALLPERYRRLVRGFVINKFRGDPALLAGGLVDLEDRTGVPTLGVVPFVAGVAIDAEDSLALRGRRSVGAGALDVAVVAWPTISNFTDVDALAVEPGVTVRLVDSTGALGHPDLVVLPGSKSTVADLAWLRARGLDAAIRASGATVLGVCGGYQVLGRSIRDEGGVEATAGTEVAGLGWLDVSTTFGADKVTRRRSGRALGQPVHGYEIHHGRTTGPAEPWVELDEPEGAVSPDGAILGTSLHGLLESDAFRAELLRRVAARRGKSWEPSGVSFAAARELQWDRLADLLEAHLDLAALDRIIAAGAPA